MSVESNNLHRPLSAAQLGVWVAQDLDRASPVFNIGQYVQIHGAVDTVLFEAALRRVTRESDALRLVFSETDDGPRQAVHPSLDWNLTTLDFGGQAAPEAAAQTWMTMDMARPQELTGAPLFHFALLRVSPHCTFWYQRYHHIINDGVGVWLIARRVAQIYTDLIGGRDPEGRPFPPVAGLLSEERSYRASQRLSLGAGLRTFRNLTQTGCVPSRGRRDRI
jgi:NRPS condensation-like uncharacterized protein